MEYASSREWICVRIVLNSTTFACVVVPRNRGMASMVRMPMMAMATTNSVRVKPDWSPSRDLQGCFFFFMLCPLKVNGFSQQTFLRKYMHRLFTYCQEQAASDKVDCSGFIRLKASIVVFIQISHFDDAVFIKIPRGITPEKIKANRIHLYACIKDQLVV